MNCIVKTFCYLFLALGLIACSGSTEFENAGGTSEEAEGIIAISNKTIAGVSQKGPFVTGSTVVLKETRGSKLSPTGKEYLATIRNDKGEFKIDNINLESQFVLLTATGYYIGESDYGISDCEVSLNAVSNLSHIEETNINLYTHLQYNRILQLIKKGSSYSRAKKQANEELMKNFGFEDFLEDPEKLNITGSSESDTTLLFMSTLFDDIFHYKLAEADTRGNEEHCQQVQGMMDEIALDFEKDGKLSKESLRLLKEKANDFVSTSTYHDKYARLFLGIE